MTGYLILLGAALHMTCESHVFIRKQDIPSALQWAQAIGQSKFDLVMQPGFALPESDAYFIPCSFENLASGFDLLIEAVDFDDYCFDSKHRAQIDDRDYVVSFKTHCNAQEIAGMIVASGVLAESFNGVIVSELQDELVLPGHNRSYIQEHLSSCREQFNGPCGLRDAYDPEDPTANTIPKSSPWVGLVLLAIIVVFMLIVGMLRNVSRLITKLKKKPMRKPAASDTDAEDDDLAHRSR